MRVMAKGTGIAGGDDNQSTLCGDGDHHRMMAKAMG